MHVALILKDNFEEYLWSIIHVALILRYSGVGSVQFLQQLCTSGYKYDTFSICSPNLPYYKIDSSQRIFTIFKMATLIFKMAVKLIQIDHYLTYKSKYLTINLKMSVFSTTKAHRFKTLL